MDRSSAERRRYPRAVIDYRGVLETVLGDRVDLRARNISGSGMYFDTAKQLTEFIEISLQVLLPSVGAGPELSFRCGGVVVRVEDHGSEGDWPFGVAIHFNDIDEEHRQAVCAYVNAVLAESRKGLEARGGKAGEC
jgi:hypothetical protein